MSGPARRAVLAGCAAALLAPLGGCGFQPVYATGFTGGSGAAQAGLSATTVGIIPERAGQLFRQALQERFQRFGTGVEQRFALQASLRVSDDALAIEPDSTVTRIRVVGFADYTLRSLDAARRTLTSGSARSVDGYDVINQQFFAGDLENEQVVRRVAEALADQVALQLATWFDAHPSQA